MKILLLLISLLIWQPVFADEVYVGGVLHETVELLEFDGLSTSGVSPSNKARIYYDVEDAKLKASENGGAYGDLGGGTTTFLGLTDTPANYTGDSGKYVAVNVGETALEFSAGGAGSGDVTSVGDCADGACLDGSSDGGTYIRLYDGDSHYLELNPGNITANRIIVFRNAAGTALLSGDTLTGDVTATFDTDGSTVTAIGNDKVDSAHYIAGSIDAEHLAADVIDETKIADNGIDSEHYNDASIDEAHLNISNAGTDNYLLSYNQAGANFTWIAAAGGGDLLADGTVPLTADWDVGNFDITLKALTGDGTIEGATLTEGGNAVYNSTETPGGELGGTWASPTIDDSVAVTGWTLTTPSIATSLTVTDDDWIGLGAAAARIEFDDQVTDEINILGADVGIGTSTPSYKLDVSDQAVMFGSDNTAATRTNATTKAMRVFMPHYTLAEEPTILMTGSVTSTGSTVHYGGGTSLGNAVTGMKFYTATNNTTTTGTQRVRMTSTGNIGIGDNTPDSKVEIIYVSPQLRLTHTDGVDDAVFGVDANGYLTVTPSGKLGILNGELQLKNGATSAGILRIFEDSDDGTNKTTFIVPALAADIAYTLPPDDGDNLEVLHTDGAGVLTWSTDDSAGSTAWDDIGNPDADSTIAMAGYETLFTSTLNEANHSVFKIDNTTADLTADVALLTLEFTDNGDSNGRFLLCNDNNGDAKFSVRDEGDIYFLGVKTFEKSTTGQFTITNPYKTTFSLQGDLNGGGSSTDNAYEFHSSIGSELTSSNTEQSWIDIAPKVNESGTAGYNALKVNVTETQTGDGTAGDGNNLVWIGVGGTSKFKVSNAGVATADGLTLGANENITLGAQTLDHDGTDFVFNDTVKATGLEITSASNISGQKQHLRFNIFDPNGVQSDDAQVCIWPKTDAAITITKLTVTLNAAGNEIAGNLEYADAFIAFANAVVINDFDTTSGVREDSTITSGAVASGKAIYISFDSAPNAAITQACFDVEYSYD